MGKVAIELVQNALQNFLIKTLGQANWCAIHRRRVTVGKDDIRLLTSIEGDPVLCHAKFMQDFMLEKEHEKRNPPTKRKT